MAFRDVFKVSLKTFVNPAAWIDLNALIGLNRFIWSAVSTIFTIPAAKKQETFEEAMKRLHLTEEDIYHAANRYHYYAISFLLLGLLLFLYSFFILFHYFTLIGWILGLAASSLLFAQAFKYHFWAFQIKRRRLGATFAEWKNSILGD